MLNVGQPVTLKYVKKDGSLIEMENVVSLRYEYYLGTRTIKLLHNNRKITIHDCCIVGINEFEVFL